TWSSSSGSSAPTWRPPAARCVPREPPRRSRQRSAPRTEADRPARARADAPRRLLILCHAVTATVLLFHRIDRRAAALLLPYLCWAAFAAPLNWWIRVENG
ncbi:hypothetical protein G6W58_24320, partial [Streptomyces sp. KAI-27]|nr:hypothetical protein [Streptomyces sp. KAI-27]NUV50415.1 hypothetical protein [Streptomyces sp. CAI-78]